MSIFSADEQGDSELDSLIQLRDRLQEDRINTRDLQDRIAVLLSAREGGLMPSLSVDSDAGQWTKPLFGEQPTRVSHAAGPGVDANFGGIIFEEGPPADY